MLNDCKKLINKIFMENKIVENLEQLKKMLVLLSEERKVVLSHHKTFEHVEKMRAIVDESIEMANKQWVVQNIKVSRLISQIT